MFDSIVQGLTIGFLISAPMGPIGLLCIQRTLSNGRWHGFLTGIGAVFSDMLYALIVGIGISFLLDFIETHIIVLQITGSIVLMGFGVHTFQKNPVKTLRKPKTSVNYVQDIVSSFFLTLSNPLIIILFIGLFARFNFVSPEVPLFHRVVGFIFIAVGALAWWFFISTLMNILRGKFNVRAVWVVNKVIGVIIFIASLAGLIATLSGESVSV